VGSAPILVVGTTGDPATPYAMAQHVAKLLQNGHLVTYHGDGHTAYNKGTSKGNLCVNNVVDNFFVNGTVPATDPNC
jgi:pimeloyl-ACP methyl ester carboxylesterase